MLAPMQIVVSMTESGATVELAGALSGTSAGGNRVAVTNDSTTGGLLVSTANQTVGAITELPYGGRNVRRWSNTYRITTRRITVAS